MLGILKKIEYALRKDSLTDHERVADARSLVCAEISRVERQPNRMGGEVLTKALNAFSDFINEPTQYEDKRMVRDYRHELARKWIPVFEAIQAALVAPPTPNRTGTTPSVGGEDIAIIRKFVKENVGGQLALDALDRLASGDAVAWTKCPHCDSDRNLLSTSQPNRTKPAHSEYLLDTLMEVYADAVNNGDGYLGKAQLEYTLMKHDLCLVDARDREPNRMGTTPEMTMRSISRCSI